MTSSKKIETLSGFNKALKKASVPFQLYRDGKNGYYYFYSTDDSITLELPSIYSYRIAKGSRLWEEEFEAAVKTYNEHLASIA